MVKERYRWVIESIIYCAAIMLGVIVVTVGPMLIILTKELQIIFTQAGFLSGVIPLAMG